MSDDAVIINNRATGKGGGVCSDDTGILKMFGGLICNNTANWGGVNSRGVFEMSGDSKIVSNTAMGYGGGVYTDGFFKMTDNSVIGGNTGSSSGGGVFIYVLGAFEMSGYSLIVNNTASSGGGVYIEGGIYGVAGHGTFTMSGGTISSNTATYGGGVYNRVGTFNRTDGVIFNNNATSDDSDDDIYNSKW